MSLAANALITVAEYLDMADRDRDAPGVAENEAFYEAHINAASQLVETWLKRIICPLTDINEIFDGDGTRDYYVRHRKINSEPTLYYWGGTTWTEMTTAAWYWTYDGSEGVGRVYFQRGYSFSEGSDNYKISYNTGYAQSSVPSAVKLACFTLVQRAVKRAQGKEGVQSETLPDMVTSYNLDKMPDTVVQLLRPYESMRGRFG
jgi:hypothetical protein